MQQANGIASIFTESLGTSIGEAIKSHDWTPVGEELAGSLSQLFTQLFAGMGPFGGFIGGLMGSLFSGLGGLFGGGSSKSQRGESISNPLYTYDVRAEGLLTALLNATKVQRLQQAAAGGDSAAEYERGFYLQEGNA